MKKLKIAILSSYPLFYLEKEIGEINIPKTSIATWTVNLCKGLSDYSDFEIHLITETKLVRSNHFFKKEGIFFHIIKEQKRLNSYSFFFFNVIRINKVLKKINPDIIHVHHTDKYALAAIKYNKNKTIITIHGVYNEIYKNLNKTIFSGMFFMKTIEKYILKRVTTIISINPYILSVCQKYMKNNVRIYNIENPVNKIFFLHSINKDLQNEILLIGTIYKLKNIMMALKSINVIKKTIPNIKLNVIGPIIDKHYYDELIQYVNKNSLNENVNFIGYCDNNCIKKKMMNSKILILTSFQESAPTVISEAMASGLPVIATNVGGVKHMVEDGETGYVVKSNDSIMLARKIIGLLKNPDLREEMGQYSKQQAYKRYYPDKVVKKTRKIYFEIMDLNKK